MNTSDNLSDQPDEVLALAYRNAASEHGRFSTSGQDTEANTQAEFLSAVCCELRVRGAQSQQKLLVLLEDDDEFVRSWAGTHALEFAADHAEPVLVSLADGDTLAALTARMTLREWYAGRLAFP